MFSEQQNNCIFLDNLQKSCNDYDSRRLAKQNACFQNNRTTVYFQITCRKNCNDYDSRSLTKQNECDAAEHFFLYHQNYCIFSGHLQNNCNPSTYPSPPDLQVGFTSHSQNNNYCEFNFPINSHVCLSVGWLVSLSAHQSVVVGLSKFIKAAEVPCSYRDTCLLYNLLLYNIEKAQS